MNASTLFSPSQRAPAHYNSNVYDSDSSDSDSSSDEESVVDDNEAVENDEAADEEDTTSVDGEEESVEGDDDDESPSSNQYPHYQVDDDNYETEDLEEDSLSVAGEGLDDELFGDEAVEETEHEMEDFLVTALEEEGNNNERPLEERVDSEVPLQAKVAVNDLPPPSTVVEDQINTIQPSLPAPDLLPVPKPTKRSRASKSKDTKVSEQSYTVNSSSVNEPRDDAFYAREWDRTKTMVKMRYNMPFMLANAKRLATDGNPSPSGPKRAREVSQSNPSQDADQDTVRTPKRARLDHNKASSSAKVVTTNSPNPLPLVGGSSAPVESSLRDFRQLWNEVQSSSDYKPVEVPSYGKGNYHPRLLSTHPHLKGHVKHAFFAKEYRLDDNKAIMCPLKECGVSSTVGNFPEHAQCHKNGEGKFACTMHAEPKAFASDKTLARHIMKEHVGHYRCPHCDTKLRPEMNKFVNHLLICRKLLTT